jgi:co-chaperonin GroES (HSP10)
MTVKVGDIVLAQKWAGTYLSEGKYYMLREESILAIE